jgi:hypothetical protein
MLLLLTGWSKWGGASADWRGVDGATARGDGGAAGRGSSRWGLCGRPMTVAVSTVRLPEDGRCAAGRGRSRWGMGGRPMTGALSTMRLPGVAEAPPGGEVAAEESAGA